jgi:hypothetical protein
VADLSDAHGGDGGFGGEEDGGDDVVSSVVFCRPDQCSLTSSYVDNNSSLISE